MLPSVQAASSWKGFHSTPSACWPSNFIEYRQARLHEAAPVTECCTASSCSMIRLPLQPQEYRMRRAEHHYRPLPSVHFHWHNNALESRRYRYEAVAGILGICRLRGAKRLIESVEQILAGMINCRVEKTARRRWRYQAGVSYVVRR